MSGYYCEYTLIIKYKGINYEYFGYESLPKLFPNAKRGNIRYGNDVEQVIWVFEKMKKHYYKWIMEGRKNPYIMLYQLMDKIHDFKTIEFACEFDNHELYSGQYGYNGNTIVGEYDLWAFTITAYPEVIYDETTGLMTGYKKQTAKEMQGNVAWFANNQKFYYEKYKHNITIVNEISSHKSKEWYRYEDETNTWVSYNNNKITEEREKLIQEERDKWNEEERKFEERGRKIAEETIRIQHEHFQLLNQTQPLTTQVY